MSQIVLVVEDERALRETLVYSLQKEGYEVHSAADGRQAIESARKVKPELIILDIMLPELDGFEVCRILRKEISTPILMLTARDDEIDRVVGLEVGADDYLAKPFSMRELMARVKAQLRRSRLHREEIEKHRAGEIEGREMFEFGDLIVNPRRGEVTLRGEPLALKPQEYQLLLFFAEHKGQMLSRNRLLERVWGWDFTGDSRTVDVHVRWLRQKIESDPSRPERIVTVRGGGYRFDG